MIRTAVLGVCAVLLSGLALVAPTAARASKEVVCDLKFQLTFTASLPVAIPAARSYSITGGGGTCDGLGATSIDITSATNNTATVSCAALAELSGSGTFVFSSGSVDFSFAAAGPSTAQSWTFVTTTPGAAEGIFTWTNTDEITACAGGTGTVMSLWGVVAVAT
jgi:hypothetical protein